jgi:hypothetical protein
VARKLTKAERDANVKAGLTPTGKIPTPRTRGEDKPPKFPAGDYRCSGNAFTATRKNRFCTVLRETGEKALAAADVGVHIKTAERHRHEDQLFREAWDEALRQHAAVYAKEMYRRGVEGWDEPVFGSQGKDAGVGVVGWVRKYSDRLLIEQARKHDPGYTPTQRIEQKVEHSGPGLALGNLSPESQDQLREILERELSRVPQEEAPDDPE